MLCDVWVMWDFIYEGGCFVFYVVMVFIVLFNLWLWVLFVLMWCEWIWWLVMILVCLVVILLMKCVSLMSCFFDLVEFGGVV